ncbi:MAG: DUF480 domain-containing protein, partial [Thermoguttaceae bacterium]
DNRTGEPQKPEPRWQPLTRTDRRVAGVLVEKAKTTPSAYPMTVNAIVAACNQKSNRYPMMQLTAEDVEESLERLRHLGAIGQIEGFGRVDKYRHYLYDWLGVEKVELSVMAELLLRGPQTVGELRARAARMDPITDVGALQPILQSLKAKGLVLSLTPEGRGHVVTHALFTPPEMVKVKEEFSSSARPQATDEGDSDAEQPSAVAAHRNAPVVDASGEAEELRSQVAQLRADFEELASAQRVLEEAVRRLREDLGA